MAATEVISVGVQAARKADSETCSPSLFHQSGSRNLEIEVFTGNRQRACFIRGGLPLRHVVVDAYLRPELDNAVPVYTNAQHKWIVTEYWTAYLVSKCVLKALRPLHECMQDHFERSNLRHRMQLNRPVVDLGLSFASNFFRAASSCLFKSSHDLCPLCFCLYMCETYV